MEHDTQSQRQRDSTAHAVADYVEAQYRGITTRQVLRMVTAGMKCLGASVTRRQVGNWVISAARSRLVAEAMQRG